MTHMPELIETGISAFVPVALKLKTLSNILGFDCVTLVFGFLKYFDFITDYLNYAFSLTKDI